MSGGGTRPGRHDRRRHSRTIEDFDYKGRLIVPASRLGYRIPRKFVSERTDRSERFSSDVRRPSVSESIFGPRLQDFDRSPTAFLQITEAQTRSSKKLLQRFRYELGLPPCVRC